MLSISNITSSSAALSYYEEDDYYSKGSIDHKNSSLWLGQGAKSLDLEGQVDREDFKNILEGKLPNGEIIGKKQAGEIKHAVGIDMTFSAPKSVSILAEVLGEEKILDLHYKAVKNALKYAEENFISTRVKNGDKIEKQQTKSMIAATFTHNTSRNLDPQLHTHCVVANIVKRNDGKWRSAWFGDIFDNKKLLGAIYRLELAQELSKEGYEIIRTHSDGRFEIGGVPKDVIEIFSSRSKEIKEALANYDFINAKTAADATLKTRDKKQVFDREILDKAWGDILEKQGYKREEIHSAIKDFSKKEELQETKSENFIENKWRKFVEFLGFNDPSHIKEKEQIEKLSKKNIATKSIEYALEHLGERQSVFEKKDIMLSAIGHSIGELNLKDIEKSFEAKEKNGEIFKSTQKELENFYTTKPAIEKEAATILMMRGGKNKVNPIVVEPKDIALPAEFNLNKSQRLTLNFALSAKDRIVGIQGYAGVGKTYTLKAIKNVAENNGYKLFGMAPSASAALTLQNEAGIESQTIHRFLFKYDGLINDRGTKQGLDLMKKEMKNTLLVLDESSLASTNQIHSLLKVVNKLDLRLLMVGDIKQLEAIEAGKPFYQLQKAGMRTIVMEDILRQKDMQLKAAVEGIIKGEVLKAFWNIKNIIEAEKPTKIVEKVVNEFMSLDKSARDKTLILAPANETRESINKMLREKLLEQKLLSDKELKLDGLKQKDMTTIEKSDARSYAVGDFILFNKKYKSLGINDGDYLRVIGVNQQKKEVLLENASGKVIIWNPNKIGAKRIGVVEVYAENKISLREGDKIVWKRNSKQNSKIINSELAIVKEINENGVLFKTAQDKDLFVEKNNPDLKHLDHGYATTVFSAQGKTSDNVIAVAESYREYLTNQKSFYVTISRARNKVTLVLDDKQKVYDKLLEFTGEKISALESQRIHERQIENHPVIHNFSHTL